MFIKRAKSRPSIRVKRTDGEASHSLPSTKSSLTAEDGDVSMDRDGDEGGSVMERKKAREKVKKSVGKGSRLSFGGDNDGGREITPFKPKKSLLSQSLKLPTALSTADPETRPTPPSNSSVYSSEYLSQLKASTPSKAPQQATVDEEEKDDGTGLSRAAREKYASTITEDTTAGIPDAAAIASARMKRQAAVEGVKDGLGDDYVALGGGQIAVYDNEKGPHPESRLMREEDEGDEGDEDLAEYTEANERLHLGKGANKAAARRLKGEIGEMIDDFEAEDEDDEETREWEEAQVKRSGKWEPEPAPVVKKVYVPTPMPIARPVPTIGSAQARIAKFISELRSTREESEHNLQIARRELASLETEEQILRKEVENVEGKREWVEEFRRWVELLGSFLEEKMPKLQDIEADALHHLKERAEMTNRRRAADDEDDLALFLGCPAASGEPEVDNKGRTHNAEAGPSSTVRRARRSERDTRRVRRRARQSQSRQTDDEGYSTDSTLADGDADDYAVAHSKLERRVIAMLDDVRAEDFRDPDKGLAVRFGGWRKMYEEEYVNAFGGLAMVQAWEFWARGEMVGWEPLRPSSPLEAFSWFTSLYNYSHPKQTSNGNSHADEMDLNEESPLGPGGDLVSEMVSKAVIPLLTKSFAEGAYDPYSASQTRKAVDLADVVRDLTGTDSQKYTTLLKAVFGVFHFHLIELASLVASSLHPGSIPPPPFDPASRTALQRFVRRRLKLVRNLLLWRREAPAEVKELTNKLVGDVIRPTITRSWDGGGKEIAAQVLIVAGNELRPDLAVFLRNGPGRGW